MAYKLYNFKTKKFAISPGSDSVGAFIQFENGVKEYQLTTAITATVTATTAAVGSFAKTSNATGRGKLFSSNGTNWVLANA